VGVDLGTPNLTRRSYPNPVPTTWSPTRRRNPVGGNDLAVFKA